MYEAIAMMEGNSVLDTLPKIDVHIFGPDYPVSAEHPFDACRLRPSLSCATTISRLCCHKWITVSASSCTGPSRVTFERR